jgi:aminopeptidase
MFTEDILDNYAEVLLWGLGVARRAPFKKSDVVLVRFDAPALPLAETLVEKLHENGQVPVPRMEPTPRMERAFYLQGNRKRLLFEAPGERELYQNLAGSIRCIAPMRFGHLDDIDPDYFGIAQQGRRGLLQILSAREQAGLYGWTLGVYPTQALADEAGIGLDAYAEAIRKACMLGCGSPVLQWKLLRKEMQALTDRLNALDLRTLRVQSASMDLLLTLGEQRKWVCLSGRNIPSFEIYVSPDWRGTEGAYFADFPMRRNGRLVSELKLEFRQGEAVQCSAKVGEEYAISQLRSDAGANKLGEFALVDKRFSRIDAFLANPLFDENYSGPHGSCHIALGQSYLNTCALPQAQLDAEAIKELGFNISSLHWDLVNTEEKRVVGTNRKRDKIRIYENGQFTI